MALRRLVSRRNVLLAVLLLCLVTPFLLTRERIRQTVQSVKPAKQTPPPLHLQDAGPCSEDLAWLDTYELSNPFQYAHRQIFASPATGDNASRPNLTLVDEPLFDAFTSVNLAASSFVNVESCLKPLTLQVPRVTQAPVDASHLVFALQTTMLRLASTIDHLGRWLPHTGARLYAVVVEDDDGNPSDDNEMRKLQQRFREKGMDVTVMHPVQQNHTFPERYFSLPSVAYAHRDEKTQWAVVIDDDTFFPSLRSLVEALKPYNSSEEWYLGNVSEDKWQSDRYGMMAFGGAGVFLSLPVAKTLHELQGVFKPWTPSGDITLKGAVEENTSARLTPIAGLHQVDILDDHSGLYEGGRELLSVHHWKPGPWRNNGGFAMEKLHLVADVCDNCFLQRWQFPGDLVVTNGFSISEYPLGHLDGTNLGSILGSKLGKLVGDGEAQLDLSEMEMTWGERDMDMYPLLGPLRKKLSDKAKIQYMLLDSIKDGSTVRQVYLKKGESKSWFSKRVDAVMVLDWAADGK